MKPTMASLDPVLTWVYFVLLCVISVIALSANIIVLTWKPSDADDRMCFARLGHLLASQALANMATAIVFIPLWLFILIVQHKSSTSLNLDELNDICVHSFDVFHGLLANLHLVVIATERACAIGWPIIHRTAAERITFIASVSPWLVSSSLSSIMITIYYFTTAPILAVVSSSTFFGLPALVTCAIFLTVSLRFLQRELTPTQENNVTISKAMAFVFLSYFITSLPYHAVNVLNFFCASCDLTKVSTSIGLRCLLYSSSALIPMAVILSVPDLRAKVQWCCFRFHAINEESHNDLHAMEVPGIKSTNNSCTLVNTTLKKDEPVQDEIPL